jgi:hypothetical protein
MHVALFFLGSMCLPFSIVKNSGVLTQDISIVYISDKHIQLN